MNESTAPPAPEPATTWTAVRRDMAAAIRGRPQDYTSGPIGRAILLLAVPMVLETSMFSIFAVCDAYFLGLLGPEAVAAVGLTEALLSIIFAIGLGLSMGTAATVARRIGEQKPREAAVVTGQAIGLALIAGLVLGLGGALLARRLLGLMGAEERLLEIGTGYAVHIFAGAPIILLLFLINAAFRGAGDPVLSLRALAIANLSNIVLDPIFIFGWGPVPEYGVTGAAIATNLGRGLGVIYQLSILVRGRGRLRVRASDLRWRVDVMTRLLRLSGVAIVQFFIAMSSFTGLVIVLTPYSSEALAGYTIAMRILIFVLLPAWGMANASATLVGQNLGAAKPERAERSVWRAARYNFIFLSTIAVLFLLAARPLVSLFTDDETVIRFGAQCLRIVSGGYLPMAFGMAMVSAFNGAGDTTTPTWINLACHWFLKLPLAWFLTWTLGWGAAGVFTSIPIAEVAVAAIAVVLFRRGRWKTQSV